MAGLSVDVPRGSATASVAVFMSKDTWGFEFAMLMRDMAYMLEATFAFPRPTTNVSLGGAVAAMLIALLTEILLEKVTMFWLICMADGAFERVPM